MTTSIPVIDLHGDPALVARELDDVCSQVGFFQIVGHDVPAAVTQSAWDAAAAFFDLPLADRMASLTRPGDPYGYSPMAAEALNRSLAEQGAGGGDLKEVFNSGPLDAPAGVPADSAEAWVWRATPWPAALPQMREAWGAYHAAMLELSTRLMSLFARGLSLPADHFAASIDRSPSALRAIRYPARDTAPGPGQRRAGEHTDYGTLTLLRQDTVGGLQVRTSTDDWADVESIPAAFVVNIGDLMAQWTNDRWRSTLHRVVDPVSEDGVYPRRHSMPFFHNANWDAKVECLPTCVRPGQAPRHETVLAGPHLMAKFARTVVGTDAISTPGR